MELEQRVKCLEHEIKILKNEVQRTLLDIEEQILVHYYPSLRSQETEPPDNVAQAMEAIRGRPVTLPEEARTAVRKVSLEEAIAIQPEIAFAPAVKKVSLDEARVMQPELAHSPVVKRVFLEEEPVTRRPPIASSRETGHSPDLKLLEWGVHATAKIGGKSTGDIVRICGERGMVDPDLKEMLVRITDFSQGTPARNVPPEQIQDQLVQFLELLGHPITAEEAFCWIEEESIG